MKMLVCMVKVTEFAPKKKLLNLHPKKKKILNQPAAMIQLQVVIFVYGHKGLA